MRPANPAAVRDLAPERFRCRARARVSETHPEAPTITSWFWGNLGDQGTGRAFGKALGNHAYNAYDRIWQHKVVLVLLAEAQVQVRHSRLHYINAQGLRLRISRCASRYEERSEMLVTGIIRRC